MNFKPAEADRDILDRLEAPEQQACIVDVVRRQPRFEERSLEPVAFPRREWRGQQAAAPS